MSPEHQNEAFTQAAANADMKIVFRVPTDAPQIDFLKADQENLYGAEPRSIETIEIGEKKYGVEIYLPKSETPPTTWVVTQHGYGGKARDYSKLAELLNKENIGVMALDMHTPQGTTNNEDKIKQMSMSVDEWANAASEIPQTVLKQHGWKTKKLIFIGQSSGGSGGAGLLIKGKESHPYDGAILIGPTLITCSPDELIKQMDQVVKKYAGEQGNVMLDWKWLAPLLEQFHDPKLNRAYQAYLVTTPGFPLPAARECVAIVREKIIGQLAKIDVPTFMVKGKHDHVDEVSLKVAEETLAAQPNSNINIKPQTEDAGHQVHIEKPKAIAALVQELLMKLAEMQPS